MSDDQQPADRDDQPSKPTQPRSRKHLSRELAMQALYQWQLTAQDIGVINGQFLSQSKMAEADTLYFQELFQHIPLKLNEIEDALISALTRPLSLVNPVEKGILWIATYELAYRLDIPYKVILNEAIELSKAYGGDGAHTLVNATLDKLAQNYRKLEIAAKKSAASNKKDA